MNSFFICYLLYVHFWLAFFPFPEPGTDLFPAPETALPEINPVFTIRKLRHLGLVLLSLLLSTARKRDWFIEEQDDQHDYVLAPPLIEILR